MDRAYVVTVNTAGDEYATGHVVIDGNRITQVAPGAAPTELTDTAATYVDGRGCLLTPGLVNTHHHLYQWVTRGMAVDETLFGWLTTLYPVWARLDEDAAATAAGAALAHLARTGCTMTTDHHYVFPKDGGDLLGAEIHAAGQVGLRFHPCRGSMDLGQSRGGLPPDHIVEEIDAVLEASHSAIDRWHDTSPDAMTRIALAPCSPFTVTGELMRLSAELARSADVLLHTHLAETADEAEFSASRFGCTPLEYVEQLGWAGPDVWYAHGIHLSHDEIARIGRSGTGIAHCPTSNGRLGAGIAPTTDLMKAGARVGLGVDGAASNESCDLWEEMHHAVLLARAVGGPTAMAVRDALRLATMGGADVLGRAADTGSIEPCKLADLALWRMDTLAHAGIADPVAALVLGGRPPLETLIVNGRVVVTHDVVITVEEHSLARDVERVHRALTS
ncbi:8-oxoguanine deaminase [Phytoactinopolyspora endophytica]|uniref:8-oxoguanine deaminase n=1 Tax=Phytoactinopolyspora endophytica TaxID=1642495 RepID=UPI00101E04CE